MSVKDDLIVYHPHFHQKRIHVCNGQMDATALQTEFEQNPNTVERQNRFEAEDLLIQFWTMGNKMRLMLLILALGSFLSTLLFLINPSGQPLQDWTEIDLPSEGIYGFLKQDRSHREGIRFRFTLPWQGQNNLTFTPGSENGKGTLIVSLDGLDIFNEVVLSQGWGNKINLTIPSTLSRDKSHVLEFRPHFPDGNISSWGIRDVRIVPFLAGNLVDHNLADDIALALATLEDPMVQGADFSHCFIVLTDHIQQTNPDTLIQVRALRERVEHRMHDLVSKAAIRIRSAIFSGQASEANHMMKDLKEWVPGTWTEGKDMLRELDLLINETG